MANAATLNGLRHYLDDRTPGFLRMGMEVGNAKTADEALAFTGLDYQVTMEQLTVNAYDENCGPWDIVMPDRFATVAWLPEGPRPMDVVSGRYNVLQNTDAFKVCTDLVDDSDAKFVCAGALQGGKRVFIGMQLPGHMLVGGVDPLDTYLLAWNSHDGGSALRLAITNVRIWCTNQLQAALRTAKSTFSIKHTNSMTERLQAAREALALTFKYQAEVEAEFERMLDKAWTDAQFEKLVMQLLPIDPDADPLVAGCVEQERRTMENLWTAPTQENIAGTAYAAYQAAVEYADWYIPVKGLDQEAARAKRQLLGNYDDLKLRAFDLTRVAA